MTHAFSGERRVPLTPLQTTPFTGRWHVPVRRQVFLSAKTRRPALAPLYGPPRPTVAAITADYARRHGLRVSDLRGASRLRFLAHKRQELWWLLRASTSASFPQIGRYFGRDHTTVLHGVRAHEKRMAEARS